jgi:Leucine-rich repeat (LRR) protein
MKNILLLLLVLPIISFKQIVNIPDANFKAYLVRNTAINTNGDTEIQVSEASSFNDTIDFSAQEISDLTGIEAFTALTTLYCGYNQLRSLDVSKNKALTRLWCQVNQLTSLDVSKSKALNELYCVDNNFDCYYLMEELGF